MNFEVFELGFRGENHDHLDKDDFEIFFLNPKIQPSYDFREFSRQHFWSLHIDHCRNFRKSYVF